MIVSDIATRVKRAFGDEAGAQFDDTDVIRWVNDAQVEICKADRLLQVTAAINTVAGQAAYAFTSLPNPILELQVVRYDGHTLRGISKEEADTLLADRTAAGVGTGTPAVFWAWANSLYLFPAPDSVKALSVDFTREPVAVAAVGNTPELPTRWHTRIVDYCLAQAYLLDDNQQAYGQAMARFEQRVAAEAGVTDSQPSDVYPYMTCSPADADGGWSW